MLEQKPYIITIVGPESSGKTTLARQLGAEFGSPWVPEYAREYLESRGGYYNETDLGRIADGQIEVIGKLLSVIGNQYSVFSLQSSVSSKQLAGLPSSPLKGVSVLEGLNQILDKKDVLTFYREDFGDEPRPVVIIDSGMMGMRMWAKIKYNISIPVVEEALREDVTSMYILCRPVFPWASDPLREAPLLRDRVWIYNHFLKELFLNQSM